MDENDIEDFVEEITEEATAGDTKLERWLVKKAVSVFTDGLTKKEKAEYDGQAAREADDRRASVYMKEQREQTIFEMRKQKEMLAIQKLQTEIEQLKAGKLTTAQDDAISQQSPHILFGELPSSPGTPSLECNENPEEFRAFLEYIGSNPTSVVILGSKGYGKSALGHAILEYLHSVTGRQAVLYAPLSIKKNILPIWLRIVDTWETIPDNALVLVDEAALMLNSRNPGSKANRSFTELNAISRQKNLGLIFISQSSRSLDINALMAGDVEIIYKKPPTFAGLNERKEVKEMSKVAKKLLDSVDVETIREYSVIFASSGEVMLMKSGLSSYWNNEVSTMYKDCVGSSSQQNQPEPNTKKNEILTLSAEGKTQQEIAQKLGISQAYVSKVISGIK